MDLALIFLIKLSAKPIFSAPIFALGLFNTTFFVKSDSANSISRFITPKKKY